MALAGAGGALNDFDLLATTTVSSDVLSVTFSSLNTFTDYKHLQVRAHAHNNGYDPSIIRVNGSSSSSDYYSHQFFNDGTTVDSDNVGPEIRNGFFSSDVGAYGGMVVDVLDFQSTSKNTVIRSFSGGGRADRVHLDGGVYLNTAALTSLEFTWPNTNLRWKTNSRFSLYGVK